MYGKQFRAAGSQSFGALPTDATPFELGQHGEHLAPAPVFLCSCRSRRPRSPGTSTSTSPTHGGGLAMRRDHTAEAVSPTAATFLSRRGFLGAVGGGLAATTLAACGSGGRSTGSSSEIVFMNQSRGQAATLKA